VTGGQPEAEDAASSRPGLGRGAPAVGDSGLLHDGEAETRAGNATRRVQPVKPAEDALAFAGGYARSAVRDGDLGEPVA
jgi:hypothetical protein